MKQTPWILLLSIACAGALGYQAGKGEAAPAEASAAPAPQPPPRVEYGNTETMYDARGKAYEVPAERVYARWKGGKLALDAGRTYQVPDPQNRRDMPLTGADLEKLWRAYDRPYGEPVYAPRGRPNATAPADLAPPDELLPAWPRR